MKGKLNMGINLLLVAVILVTLGLVPSAALAHKFVPDTQANTSQISMEVEQIGVTTRVSVASDGAQANASALDASISADGRYVAFRSLASNLVPGDTNNRRDIFVHDRQTGETTRVSVASDGSQATNNSDYPSISADGRFVAFQSMATNLVTGDTNNASDIFVHDRQTGLTERVSLTHDEAQANKGSWYPSVSANGDMVAFQSYASNLIGTGEDTNGENDIFVRAIQSGSTIRVSKSSAGNQANGDSSWPSISLDGRFVAFSSDATNLVSEEDTNSAWDIFVHDLSSGETRRASVSSDGNQGEDDLDSNNASVAWDGTSVYVAFESEAGNLVIDDTNDSIDVFVHIFVPGLAGVTECVSVTNVGVVGNGISYRSSISADGRRVAFQSYADNLVNDDTLDFPDIFVHDRQTGTNERVSVSSVGEQGNEGSLYPSISANGLSVTFQSFADNLVSDDTNQRVDIFVHETILPDLIFADGFESGNLLNWSQRLRDGGDLAVTSQAALVGTKGMRAQIDDNNAIWVMDLSPEAERTYRVRFYFDPNSISMVEGDLHTIFAGIKYPGFQVLRVDLRRYLGNYQLRTLVRNDDQTWRNTRWVTISDAPHFIELFWQAALYPGANNGILTFWIDGVQEANLQNIDNDTRYIDRVRLGAVAGVDDGTRGTYYFDAFESRRQTYIGP